MKLPERLAIVGKRRHLSPLTVECYQRWVKEFLTFHRRDGRWRHPAELGGGEVEEFLNYLAHERRVAASTQNLMPKASGPRALGNHDNLYPRLT
jgi:hypothetical protein